MRTVAAVVCCAIIAAAGPADARGGPGHPGSEVVDSAGNPVGRLVELGWAERLIDGMWVAFHVSPAGLGDVETPLQYFYTSTDCSGTPYLFAYSLPVFAHSVTTSGGYSGTATLYYPVSPYEFLTIHSSKYNDTCYTSGYDYAELLGTVASTTLSFVPPFRIK